MESGERSRSPRWLALAMLALGVPMSGCGASGSTALAGHVQASGGAEKKPVSATATRRSGGLIVALTAMPRRAKVGYTVQFEVTASAGHALGALGYQLRYGDGTSAENVVPQFCVAGRGVPRRQAWRLTHRYKATGRYRVSASVYVNCTSDHATATVGVIIA
jgi:hypothetical protein